MMATNPAAEDVNLVLYSLANVSRQLAGLQNSNLASEGCIIIKYHVGSSKISI